MPLTKVGLNLSAIGDVPPPEFNFSNSSTSFINDIPAKANDLTGGFYGLIVLVTLFFYLLWKLSQDQALGGDHGFDYIRGIGISGAICGIIGLYALNFGYFVNYYHVVIFLVTAFICTLVTWKSER